MRRGRCGIAAAAAAVLLAGACGAPRPTSSGEPPVSVDRAALAARVRAEALHAWNGYESFAWGRDELRPVSRSARDWYGVPLLITPVDALDTLLLLGLDAEAARAKTLILDRLSFGRDFFVRNFEITIRLLGGLLAGYERTGDARLLRLADDLGTRLLPAFASPTGMPYRDVNLATGAARGARSNPAEIGTLLLEFGTLSRHTGKPVYREKARRALLALAERRSSIGLVGEEIDVETGEWTSDASHVGGGIDSYYEYLVKCGLLFGDRDCRTVAGESLAAVNRWLSDEVDGGLWYGVADRRTGARTATEFGALQAFFPATLAIAGDVARARRLQESCFRMWTRHGLEPDAFDYRTGRVLDPHYPLRPEIAESAYVLYRATKDPRYLDMGRDLFEAIVAHCRTDAGYTVVDDVVTKRQGDLMPSYFLAETLKYLYLLFAPDATLDFDAVVFNTEAHPFRKSG